MTAGLKNYLLSLCAAAFLTTIAASLLPKGGIRRVLGICSAMVMAITALRPFVSLNANTLSQSIAQLEMQAEAARTGIEIENTELIAAIIKQNAQTYILDKAKSIGLDADVEVTVKTDAAYPYPASVVLYADATAAQRKQLGTYIAETFAIAEEEQAWKPRE